MAKVKICGITNFQDASDAVMLGADFLGFNFYKKSKRKLSLDNALEIITKLPPVFSPVGIFVDDEMNTIMQIVQKCKLNAVQLHGNETPEYCTELSAQLKPQNVKIIKAFNMKGAETLAQMEKYIDSADYFLIDSYVEGEAGGTGVSMQDQLIPAANPDEQPAQNEQTTPEKPELSGWDLAIEAKKFNKPIFLAGGLTPDNVEEAIEKVLPFAVDVATGVERLPRRKDYDKLKKFITSSKGY
ncbi:MAG: hypothetical protein A2252_10845 [Elusimicrobia bacterium RIFOXYA2_FULL_39_19]|nr:MAG: hypothetical protein A2252_10845 [Elusimicrobia bacterium RIFOXYA2_FULL_39_19]